MSKDAAREQWMKGYVTLEAACKAEKTETADQAMALYQEARDTFLAVRRGFPGWNPSLLEYRIDYCDRCIRRLKARRPETFSTYSRDQLLATAKRQAEQINALAAANAELVRELNLTRRELSRNVQEGEHVAADAPDVARLVSDNAAMREQSRVLAARLTKLATQTAQAGLADTRKSKKLESAVAVLESRNAELDRRAEEAETEVSKANQTLDILQRKNAQLADRIEELTRARPNGDANLQKLRQLLRESVARQQRLKRERDELRARNEEQLALLRQQERSLAALEAKHRRRAADAAAAGAGARPGGIAAAAMSSRPAAPDPSPTDNPYAGNVVTVDARRWRAQQQEMSRLRQALTSEQQSKSATRQPFLEQLQELTARLENERARRRALEAALSDPEALAAALPTRDVPADAERDRRTREHQLIVRGLLRRGLLAEKNHDLDMAASNYADVLRHSPENIVALQRMGLIAAERGDDDGAARYLQQAFKLNPDDVDILLHLGTTLMRQKKLDWAISTLMRAVALTPDNASARRCLGVAFSSTGWLDAAETQLRRSFELDQHDNQAAFNLAILLASRSPARLDEAREWYQRALDLGSSEDAGLNELLGVSN